MYMTFVYLSWYVLVIHKYVDSVTSVNKFQVSIPYVKHHL